MQRLIPLPNSTIPWLILLISIATLGGALLFEHLGGLAPCALCLLERQPYWVAIPSAALAGFVSRETNFGYWPLIFLGLCAMAFAIGGGISTYHAGIEYGLWPGPTSCTGSGAPMATSLEELRTGLEAAKIPRCDEIPWSLLGISLAGYNALISWGLLFLSLLPIVRFWRGDTGPDGDE